MATSNDQILIIGAGVSGLLLANALTKLDINCIVFEREEALATTSFTHEREWGMSIQWALPLLKDILTEAQYNELNSVTVDPSYEPPEKGELPTLNAQTGELLKALPLVKVYRISRSKFKAFLSRGITIKYGKSFKSYETLASGVRVNFADGTSCVGAAVVGADGARSSLRTAILGPEIATPESVPYTAINLHVTYGDAALAKSLRAWNPIYTMGIHPLGYWLWISIQNIPHSDPAKWVFQLQWSWKTQPGEAAPTLALLKERAQTLADPFKSAFLSIPEDTPISVNNMACWDPQPWDSAEGRLILLGDAVHPMTFHRGQGLNHCIADVANLAKGLSEWRKGSKELAEVAQECQAEMIPRAGDEVKLSLKNTHMLHNWDMLMQSPLMQQSAAPAHRA